VQGTAAVQGKPTAQTPCAPAAAVALADRTGLADHLLAQSTAPLAVKVTERAAELAVLATVLTTGLPARNGMDCMVPVAVAALTP